MQFSSFIPAFRLKQAFRLPSVKNYIFPFSFVTNEKRYHLYPLLLLSEIRCSDFGTYTVLCDTRLHGHVSPRRYAHEIHEPHHFSVRSGCFSIRHQCWTFGLAHCRLRRSLRQKETIPFLLHRLHNRHLLLRSFANLLAAYSGAYFHRYIWWGHRLYCHGHHHRSVRHSSPWSCDGLHTNGLWCQPGFRYTHQSIHSQPLGLAIAFHHGRFAGPAHCCAYWRQAVTCN